ncbi:hypothetical protein QFZ65_003461 [Arthrobacter sp. B3I9]|nr:hypothetical protein [Arthrobacter sp. B3I9]
MGRNTRIGSDGSPNRAGMRRSDRDEEAITPSPAPSFRSREAAVLALQRSAGNRAVQRLVAGSAAHAKPKMEGDEDKERLKDGACVVQRVLADPVPMLAVQRAAFNATLNKPAPTRSNSAASTTHADDPTFTGHAVEDKKRKRWTYVVDTVEATGTIQIVYFTNDRYPAPTPDDDSGALTNVTSGNVTAILKDFKDNREGIPDHWSAYRAEDLHEDYHWSNEWLKLARVGMTEADKKVAKLQVDTTATPAQADAEKILEPQAKTLFDAEMKAARMKWNAMGDSPGDPPYRAQAPAVDALATRVKAHKKAQKW